MRVWEGKQGVGFLLQGGLLRSQLDLQLNNKRQISIVKSYQGYMTINVLVLYKWPLKKSSHKRKGSTVTCLCDGDEVWTEENSLHPVYPEQLSEIFKSEL